MHMLSEHRDTFTDAQLGSLAQMNSKPLARPFSECPLCCGLPEDCPSLEEQQRTGKPDNLPRHIAGHLKFLAMLSLPPRDEMDKTNEVAMTEDNIEIQIVNSNAASLAFSDPPHSSLPYYDNPIDWNPPLHKRPNTEWDITSTILEGMPPYSDLPASNILVHHSWLGPHVTGRSDTTDDVWGISQFLIPYHSQDPSTDPKLAPFREKAKLFERSFEAPLKKNADPLNESSSANWTADTLFGCWQEARRCDRVCGIPSLFSVVCGQGLVG
jgi:hypothetical protein